MATYFMFGEYNQLSLNKISPDRTVKVNSIIGELGGKVTSMYAILGEYDLVIIVDLPGELEAIKASATLMQLTGIAFTTYPAAEVDKFDSLMKDSENGK